MASKGRKIRLIRALLWLAAVLLAVGAAAHAAAFGRASGVIGRSGLPAFYAGTYRVFWIADSTTMMIGGTIYAAVAIRPSPANGHLVALLALIYVAIAILIYSFIGGFFAAHMLMAASAAACLAGWLLSGGANPAAGTAAEP